MKKTVIRVVLTLLLLFLSFTLIKSRINTIRTGVETEAFLNNFKEETIGGAGTQSRPLTNFTADFCFVTAIGDTINCTSIDIPASLWKKKQTTITYNPQKPNRFILGAKDRSIFNMLLLKQFEGWLGLLLLLTLLFVIWNDFSREEK